MIALMCVAQAKAQYIYLYNKEGKPGLYGNFSEMNDSVIILKRMGKSHSVPVSSVYYLEVEEPVKTGWVQKPFDDFFGLENTADFITSAAGEVVTKKPGALSPQEQGDTAKMEAWTHKMDAYMWQHRRIPVRGDADRIRRLLTNK